jgi:class 3 adenylate cyclase
MDASLIPATATGISCITVSIGARVAAHAVAGEVLVSQTVKDLVAGSGFSFQDRGKRQLAGVPDRWRLYRVMSSVKPSEWSWT